MASVFKNFGQAIDTTDGAANDIYTAGSGVQAVVHALFISNKSETTNAYVNVKCTTDGGSNFFHIARAIAVPPRNTITIDKPINMEQNDKLRVYTEFNQDSTFPDCEVFASILEVS